LSAKLPIQSRNKEGTARGRALNRRPIGLLFLFFPLGWCRFFLRCRLRLGLFHGFLGFGSFLGAGFGALFLLCVENLLAAK